MEMHALHENSSGLINEDLYIGLKIERTPRIQNNCNFHISFVIDTKIDT